LGIPFIAWCSASFIALYFAALRLYPPAQCGAGKESPHLHGRVPN
jgi:hypothetical protein